MTELRLCASWTGRQVAGDFLLQGGRPTLLVSTRRFEDILLSFFDRLFHQGLPATHGEKLLAAVSFFLPDIFRSSVVSLPRAARALKGWRKATPTATRLPLPLTALLAIVVTLLEGQPPE